MTCPAHCPRHLVLLLAGFILMCVPACAPRLSAEILSISRRARFAYNGGNLAEAAAFYQQGIIQARAERDSLQQAHMNFNLALCQYHQLRLGLAEEPPLQPLAEALSLYSDLARSAIPLSVEANEIEEALRDTHLLAIQLAGLLAHLRIEHAVYAELDRHWLGLPLADRQLGGVSSLGWSIIAQRINRAERSPEAIAFAANSLAWLTNRDAGRRTHIARLLQREFSLLDPARQALPPPPLPAWDSGLIAHAALQDAWVLYWEWRTHDAPDSVEALQRLDQAAQRFNAAAQGFDRARQAGDRNCALLAAALCRFQLDQHFDKAPGGWLTRPASLPLRLRNEYQEPAKIDALLHVAEALSEEAKRFGSRDQNYRARQAAQLARVWARDDQRIELASRAELLLKRIADRP